MKTAISVLVFLVLVVALATAQHFTIDVWLKGYGYGLVPLLIDLSMDFAVGWFFFGPWIARRHGDL